MSSRHLEILIVPAKRDGGFQQGLSDASPAIFLGDAQPADLAHALIVMLHPDHPDHLAARFSATQK